MKVFGFYYLYCFVLCNEKICKNTSGTCTYLYLTLYAVVRFIIEHVRVDSALNISGVPIAEVVSVVMFCVGIAGIIYTIKRTKIIQNR